MRKFLAVLMILAMAATGCAGLTTATGFICSPTQEQQQTAGQMLLALDIAQATGALFYSEVGLVKASAVLRTIQTGSCFLVSELTEAFKAVDAGNAVVAKAQLKMLKAAAPARVEYPALRKFVE